MSQGTIPQTCKPAMLIGNKCDLENDRVIKKERGEAIANKLGGGRIKVLETSAKSNINVTEVAILYVFIHFFHKNLKLKLNRVV